jgi:hypothetical protein
MRVIRRLRKLMSDATPAAETHSAAVDSKGATLRSSAVI